ncbi:MAG: transcriptional repressor LexA [Chloroflexi bacterium]|nr:transcriptional repressor LexA [Chloroflexota bacterium]
MLGARQKLSDKQERMLGFIRTFIREQGYPPTIRDIQRGCEISSTSVVDYNLHILQREGYLRRSPDISRGIELLGAGRERPRASPDTVSIPLIGYIAAGEPLPVFSGESWSLEAMETLELPTALVASKGKVYGLRVRGLSMIDALIDDGDIVLLEATGQPRDGEMVAAWLQDEKAATLKRIYREGNRVRLQPANSQMEPIYTHPENVQVQGRVVGVLRLLR